MSVEDWARRESQKRHRIHGGGVTDVRDVPARKGRQEAMAEGIVHAFDALLSDEAVEAAARALAANISVAVSDGDTRAALRAAIDAVTEGGSDE